MEHGIPQYALDLIMECFQKTPHLLKVKLYGSRAIGNFRRGSDIDLAVWFSSTEMSLPEYDLQAALDSLETPYKFDVTNYLTLKHPDLQSHIDRVGKTLYTQST